MDDLSDLTARRDAFQAELAAMPEHKVSTEWHTSRLAELDLTQSQITHREKITFRPSDADVLPR